MQAWTSASWVQTLNFSQFWNYLNQVLTTFTCTLSNKSHCSPPPPSPTTLESFCSKLIDIFYKNCLCSGDLKSNQIHKRFDIWTIWNWDFQWSCFWKVGLEIWHKLFFQTFEKWTIQNPDIFVLISNGFWQNGGHLSRFQIVGLPDSKSINTKILS